MEDTTGLPSHDEFADPDDPIKADAFAMGFVYGQAEKVCLGACYAAVFRITPEGHERVMKAVVAAADLYGLEIVELDLPAELWLTTKDCVASVLRLERCELNSPEFHLHRGWLCGVPFHRIDRQCHIREGDPA